MSSKSKSQTQNYYKNKEVKKFVRNYHNPHGNDIKIYHPMRAVVVGSSGSGKTLVIIDLIKKLPDTFDHIILLTRDASEPLYLWLASKLGDLLTIHEIVNGKQIPTLSDMCKPFNSKTQLLVIFDDLCLERKQDNIAEFYVRGRKALGGISVAYLTQSYHKCPKTIRLQCDTIIIKRVSAIRDLKLIVSDFDISKNKDQLLEAYEKSLEGGVTSFLCVRLGLPTSNPHKFTIGWTEPI